VLLALAVLIALLGIANTLVLSIFERTRELGLLRAVGMTRRQVRSMVRWESVIIALLGAFLGLAIGLFASWAMVTAVANEGARLQLPVGQLAVVTLIAALAGMLAAVVPAQRASRLNVLAAIATE
jgi:putative ABC transport system permease protein